MKKFLSVLLSVLMLMTCMIPLASAAPTAAQTEPTATAALDWIDSKIQENEIAQQFNDFVTQYPVAGLTTITSLNDIIKYKDLAIKQGVLDTIGGDFKNLTAWDKIVDRTDGDIAFINGMIDFMAANKEVFGKVFSWTPDGEPFDYGKIGEFIESDEYANETVKSFYNDYLKNGFDIQDKFTAEIAREMGYTIPAGETFDDTLNNGIHGSGIGTLLRDLLKTDASKTAFDAFSTKDASTDIYAIIKAYIGLLQNDYKADLDTMGQAIVDAIAPALGEAKNTLKDIEMPVLSIGYTGKNPYAEYTPTSTNLDDYMPTIYVNDQAKDTMDQYANTEIEVLKNSEMTAADAALVNTASEAWGKDVIINVSGIDGVISGTDLAGLLPLRIVLDDVEKAVLQTLQNNVNGQGANISGVAFNISDATATFSYKAYKDDDSFAVQAKVESATAKVNITSPITATVTTDLLNPDATTVDLGGMYSMFNDIVKNAAVSAIKTAIGDMFKDPAFVTVVVNNLSGNSDIDLDSVKTLLGYVKDDVVYDADLFNFIKYYDTYKGAVGQANRVLYDAAFMILSPEGIAYVGLQQGGNDKLDANVTAIRTKAAELLDGAKDAINTLKSNPDLAEYIPAGIDLDTIDFGMLDQLDLSSNEALYVSLIKAADQYIPAELDEIKDLIAIVKNEATLDDMLVALINEYAPKFELPEGIAYTFTAIPKGGNAEDNIMKEATKAIFAGAEWAVGVANDAVSKISTELGLGEAQFALNVSYNANNWRASLEALVDRFISLTDGLFISPITGNGLYGKLGDILYKALPMDSMFSNVKSGADVAKIPGYIFGDALNGNFANVLSLAETKEDAVAGGVSINKALINASERIVKAFFPTTVSAATYNDYDGVQEYFTGAENDPKIAARNMQDIADRKADLVSCGLNLLKESGVLVDVCAHAKKTETVITASTCKTAGTAAITCAACGKAFENKTLPLDANNHEGPIVEGVNAKAATTSEEGYTGDKVCQACGQVVTAGSAIAKLPEPAQSTNFFQRIINSIRNIFANIRNFFARLFGR